MILCSVEGDCFGEVPSCSSIEDFVYTQGKRTSAREGVNQQHVQTQRIKT